MTQVIHSLDDMPTCLECWERSKWICELDERLSRKFGTKASKEVKTSYLSLYNVVHGPNGNGVHPYHPKPKAKRSQAKLLAFAAGT